MLTRELFLTGIISEVNDILKDTNTLASAKIDAIQTLFTQRVDASCLWESCAEEEG